MKHLLVTNDFPPKLGGIQSYLWELWRRLPAESTTVLTTPHPGAAEFDRRQPIRVERDSARWLLPTDALVRRIDRLADEVGADLVLLDPALPLGWLGPRLERPYGVIVHGAEVTVPGRLPGSSGMLGRVLRRSRVVIAAGGYPAAEAVHAAGRPLPTVVIPPGVDVDRFTPLDDDARASARQRLGLDPAAPVLLPSADELKARLERRAERQGSPVRFLGRVPDDDLPALHASADLFVMLCRDRWGGLEQEGFGIVFLEAGSAGVAAIAGRSGGSAEAVDDGGSGLVIDDPTDAVAVVAAADHLLRDPERRRALGAAARTRVVARLHDALQTVDVSVPRGSSL